MGLTEALERVAKAQGALDKARGELIRAAERESDLLLEKKDAAGLRALAQKVPCTWQVACRSLRLARELDEQYPPPPLPITDDD